MGLDNQSIIEAPLDNIQQCLGQSTGDLVEGVCIEEFQTRR